jgi:hypothetical protein
MIKRLIVWLLSKRIEQYIVWARYEIGFTGYGVTTLDAKPAFNKPWLPKWMRNDIARLAEWEARQRRNAWKDAIRDVLGEEPDEWM